MLKQYSTVFRRLTILADLCIIAGAFYMGYFLQAKNDIYIFARYRGLLPVFVIIWGLMLYFFDMYNSFRLKSMLEVVSIIFKTAVFSLIFFISFIFMFNLAYVNRHIIMLSVICAAAFLLVEKIALIAAIRIARKKGYNYRNFLIVGTGQRAQNFISLIEKRNEWGLKVIGLVDEDPSKKGQVINGYKVLGSFDDVPSIINSNVVDEVIFVVPRSWMDRIEGVMRCCEIEGLKIHIALDYFDLKLSRPRQTDFHGFPLLTFESTSDKIWQLFIKRLFDVIFSSLAIFFLSPLFIVLAVIIKATSEGPVFFRQERCGLNGRRFMLYKFRTMFKDAEAKLEDLRKFNEMEGPVFKMENDPRITGIGKFLRKFSLDEFPQLWNVLRGDMSLIGPRPPIPKEVEKYDYWQRRRLSMKPGLSCLWQISGRNKISSFDEWMKLDLEYIDNWSLWLDAKIFLRTIPIVLFGIGAK